MDKTRIDFFSFKLSVKKGYLQRELKIFKVM